MKLVAIIQARCGSTRLPGKVLHDLCGKTMLERVIERVQRSKTCKHIIVATTKRKEDVAIVTLCSTLNIPVHCGSEDDVLERFYEAAVTMCADAVVRITADCPLICPEVIDEVVNEFTHNKYDFACNCMEYTHPEGCDVEVFTFSALKIAHEQAKDKVEREHVTPFIKNSTQFRIQNVRSRIRIDNPCQYKWSVDKEDDFEFVRAVYSNLINTNDLYSITGIIDFLKRRPDIMKINSGSVINEGYYKGFAQADQIESKNLRFEKSISLKNRVEKYIPGCSQTFSKGPTQYVQGAAPCFLEKGQGSHVWDIDGNEYIDYTMALCPIILGYNYPAVTQAVKECLDLGTTFSLPHRMELELAELMTKYIPCAEMIRYGKNGSDATSGAVRVARGFTGRDKIACCGYHGWQDWYIGTTTRNKGVPRQVSQLTLSFEYNKIETLERLFEENKNQIACVILEPVGLVLPQNNFLQKVKEITHKNGAVLIFDEIVTGFRISMGGAQEYFSVIPDIACFGKAMANGFPISVIAGKRELMKLFEDVFFSFTFGGEILSIAAALRTLEVMQDRNVIQYIWEKGRIIQDGYNVLVKELGMEQVTQCIGLPPHTVITFRDVEGVDELHLKSYFQQECIQRGLLFVGVHNLSFSHSSADVELTLRIYSTVLRLLKDVLATGRLKQSLKGECIQPVFRKF